MRQFGLQLSAGPTIEPVSLSLAKQHLRVDFSNDDQLISMYVAAARTHVEGILQRSIFEQTWTLSLDEFPYPTSFTTVSPSVRENYWGNAFLFDWTAIMLPMPRLVSVTSITYMDADNNLQTVDPATYVVDTKSEPARIVPINGNTWPYPANYTPGSVVVTYVSGTYGDGATVNNCPAPITMAILLVLGHLYANREAVSDRVMTTLPLAVDALLGPYKFYGMTF